MQSYKCPSCYHKYRYPQDLKEYESCHFGIVCPFCEQCFTVYLVLGEVLLIVPWQNIHTMRDDIMRGELKSIDDEKFGKFTFSLGT